MPAVGELVLIRLEPAVAPLLRIVDRLLRLLDLMEPLTGQATADTRQGRRQAERSQLGGLRMLLEALRRDIEDSSMLDVVVSRDDAPNVVVTLDRGYETAKSREIIHTSSFMALGTVTNVWPTEDDIVETWRRSAASAVPAVAQRISATIFQMLVGIAHGIGDVDLDAEIRQNVLGEEAPVSELLSTDQDDEESNWLDDIRVPNDVGALHPVISGPAFQVLPLALCP